MESEASTQNFALIRVVAHFANRALKFFPGSFIILENFQRRHKGWEMENPGAEVGNVLSFGPSAVSAILQPPEPHC